MKRIFLAMLTLVFLTGSALAQTSPTIVTVPFGQWLGQSATIVNEIVLLLFAWFCRGLPGYVVAMIKTFHVEQMLTKAVSKAINSVAGAGHEQALHIDVGNQVVAEALNYVTAHAPAWLVEHAGGWPLLREKIIARLKLEPMAVVKDGTITSAVVTTPRAIKSATIIKTLAPLRK